MRNCFFFVSYPFKTSQDHEIHLVKKWIQLSALSKEKDNLPFALINLPAGGTNESNGVASKRKVNSQALNCFDSISMKLSFRYFSWKIEFVSATVLIVSFSNNNESHNKLQLRSIAAANKPVLLLIFFSFRFFVSSFVVLIECHKTEVILVAKAKNFWIFSLVAVDKKEMNSYSAKNSQCDSRCLFAIP